MPVGQRNAGPDEHGGERFVDIPPDTIESPHKHIATLLITLDRFLDAILGTVEGNDAGDLQRLKDAVVEIAFDLGQRAHHFVVAHAKADPPSRHIVGL